VELLNKRSLSANLFIALVQIIKKDNSGVRQITGTKISNTKGETIYTPPEGKEVILDKLKNLEEFIHANDGIDALIKLAIIHYQFEAIHPFLDGNGRVGRILNILYLLNQELLKKPVLFLSRYFIENRNGYYEGLRKVTENNAWENWILYMLDAVESTAYKTIEKIDHIIDHMDKCTTLIKNKHPKIYSKDLIEVLFAQPYCRISSITSAKIVARQTASIYLQKIEELGLIKGYKIGKETIYLNIGLLNILKK
jgi:Fic family protein